MKHKRTYIVAAAVAAVVLALAVSPVKPGWNKTESLPVGLYLSYAHDATVPLSRGELACVPYERPDWAIGNYLYPGELLCKRVMGVPGDVVNSRPNGMNELCHDGKCEEIGKPLEHDSAGRPMQHITWTSEVIPAGMYYLGSTRRPNSMDSRYLGLMPQAKVVKTIRPVWTEQDN
jgi:conjugative transfer signal peptidase TraF